MEESGKQRFARKLRYAKRLRKRMTEAEKILWEALRDRKCAELKFRRQVPLSWYVVDFFCMERSLVVELDGPIHEQQKQYDQEREEELNLKGIRVLRFRNEEVMTDLSGVLRRIEEF